MDHKQHLTAGEIWQCLDSGPGYTHSMISAAERRKYALAVAEQMSMIRQARAANLTNSELSDGEGSEPGRLSQWLSGKLTNHGRRVVTEP